MTEPLREGEVIVRRRADGTVARAYVIAGWTSRGKVRLQGDGLKCEQTAWWLTRADLPKFYEVRT